MARQTKTSCNRCDARLAEGPYCPKCGYPTPTATHEDRVEWELRQWASPNPAAKVATTKVIHTPVVSEARSRRWFKARNGANGAVKRKAPQAGSGHKVESVARPAVEASGAESSPFAPPAEAVKKTSVKARKATTPKAPVASRNAEKKPVKQAPVEKQSKPAPAKAAPPKAAKPMQMKAAPKAAPPVAEAPKIEPKPETAKVSRLRTARRLPSLADIEEIAKQGPAMVKILRLIQVRVAILEATTDDEDVAKTG